METTAASRSAVRTSSGRNTSRRLAASAATILTALISLSAAVQDGPPTEAPLPAPEPFLKEVRARLETNATRQFGYSYLETQRRTSIDRSGRRREDPATILESYPGLPGEELRVRVIQEGKEAGQGVGFLDDGTMIVVEGGVRYIDKDLDVTVTRVLQTVAGRMIFAQPRLD